MTVYELNRDQLVELKQRKICDDNERKGEGTAWSELADADRIVTDDEVRRYFAGTDFTDGDFSC